MAKQLEKPKPAGIRKDENERESSRNSNQGYEGSSGPMFGNDESSSDQDRDIETDRESTKDVGRTTGSRTEREH